MIKFDRKTFDRAPLAVWKRWMRARKLSVKDIDLQDANLSGAELYYSDLQGANLRDANLRCANLHGANLYCANLRGANLRGVNLYCANLHDANLRGANLHGANLHDANLRGANLYCANLRDANLHEAIGPALQCPEYGAFVGWKKVQGKIVKLQITENAMRSSATGRKCRCSEALVLSIDDGALQEITNTNYWPLTYRVGELVRPDSFDENRWNECSHGIHFFITRQEAEEY